MFKATARLYDKARMLTEHTALGETVPLASQAAIKKLLDDFSIDWHSIETVVTRVEE
jgi:hypothetical protein